jgi:hypothetical protein
MKLAEKSLPTSLAERRAHCEVESRVGRGLKRPGTSGALPRSPGVALRTALLLTIRRCMIEVYADRASHETKLSSKPALH